MTNTEPLDLDAIEARALAATPGAWAYDQIPETGECRVIWDGNEAAERDSVYAITSGGSLACNAEFIAHAREDVPALVAEVRRLREVRTTCAWCDLESLGVALHNDGATYPSCGQHGQDFRQETR